MVHDSPVEAGSVRVAERIFELRGHKVILDADLAALYGVTTKQFNQAVRRNLGRFPSDFFFQLSNQEVAILRSQSVTSSEEHGGRRYAPYVFTEHGAIMAATILNTPRATEVSVFVVRAFVQLREAIGAHKQLTQRLNELEASIEKKLAGQDHAIAAILSAIRGLMTPPERPRRPIGFVAGKDKTGAE